MQMALAILHMANAANEIMFSDNVDPSVLFCLNNFFTVDKRVVSYIRLLRQRHMRRYTHQDDWIQYYTEIEFFKLYRLTQDTFHKLLNVLLQNDRHHLLNKKFPCGRQPVDPEKSLLMFLWYMGTQDTLLGIADRFNVVPSTVMSTVNNILYILLKLKNQYIFWPKNNAEFEQIAHGFTYPGAVGALDGSHLELKVPSEQKDSYIDRYMNRSINLMAVCTADRIFTYIFVGFPGSAHDSRVFSNSQLYLHIERHGKNKYFPDERYHLIADEAFPLKSWIMKPYRRRPNMPRVERHHNQVLSSSRVFIENTFGICKGRWRRLQFINTYSISKAVEVATCGCILHNFTYLNNDFWDREIYEDNRREAEDIQEDNNRHEFLLGRAKRHAIALQLLQE